MFRTQSVQLFALCNLIYINPKKNISTLVKDTVLIAPDFTRNIYITWPGVCVNCLRGKLAG